MCYSQIWQNFGGDEYLCKLGKEYLNSSLCKFVIYSLQHSETFDVSQVFLPLTVAELSTLKRVRFFWPTLYIRLVQFSRCRRFDALMKQYTSLVVVSLLAVVSLYQADAGAGRAFPIDSENYVTEKFDRINSRLVSLVFVSVLLLHGVS